ncbi:MAG: hypothetical protein ACJ73D_10910 [Pyrinomonadaceae bacterium]
MSDSKLNLQRQLPRWTILIAALAMCTGSLLPAAFVRSEGAAPTATATPKSTPRRIINSQPPVEKTVVTPIAVTNSHMLVSERVDSELSKLNHLHPTPRTPIAVPARVDALPAVTLLNGSQTAGLFECMAPVGGKDNMALEETADRLFITFTCQRNAHSSAAKINGAVDTLSIAYKKGELSRLFAPQVGGGSGSFSKSPLKRPADGTSRDDYELSNCLSEFRRHKSDPKANYFRVRFYNRVYRCDAGENKPAPVAARVSPLSSRKVIAIDQPTDLRFKFMAPAQQYDPDYHGQKQYKTVYEKTLEVFSGVQSDETMVFPVKGSKPGFAKVALQVARVTSQPPQNDPCSGWDMPTRLIQQQIVTPVFGPANLTGVVQNAGTFTINGSQLIKGLAIDKSGRAYARVVPITPGKVNKCVGGPSPWVEISVTDIMDEYKKSIATQQAKQQQQAQMCKASLSKTLGSNSLAPDDLLAAEQARSPIKVTVLSYIPPLLGNSSTVPYDLPPDQRFGTAPFELMYTGIGGETFNPAKDAKFYQWVTGVWFPGCSFNAQDLMESESYQKPADIENLWDAFVFVIDQLPGLYAKAKQYIVEGFAYAISIGNCKPNNAHPSPACTGLTSALQTGMTIALAELGLPPSLPTVNDLVNDGSDYVATQVVDYALSQLPVPDLDEVTKAVVEAGEGEVRQALLKQTKESLRKATLAGRCEYLLQPGQGTFATDEGCPITGDKYSTPFNFGIRNPAFDERPATLYLKVEGNPNTLGLSTTQAISITDGSGFFEPRTIKVNLDHLPMTIPVQLIPNWDKYAFSFSAVCSDLMTAGPNCLAVHERDAWEQAMKNGEQAKIGVSTIYRWSNDPELSGCSWGTGPDPLAGLKGYTPVLGAFVRVVWGGRDGKLADFFGVDTLKQSMPGHKLPDYIEPPIACPGFVMSTCPGGLPCRTSNGFRK